MTKVHSAFVIGRNYLKGEAQAADTLRTDDPAVQLAAKTELKLGMIARGMATWDNMPDAKARAAADALLKKAGKLRTDEEAAAENRARTALSRLFKRYGIKNLENRGGPTKKKTKVAKADGWVADKPNAVPLAAYVRPKIEEPAAMMTHAQFVAKELAATLKLAEPVLAPKIAKAYRTVFAKLAADLLKIEKMA